MDFTIALLVFMFIAFGVLFAVGLREVVLMIFRLLRRVVCRYWGTRCADRTFVQNLRALSYDLPITVDNRMWRKVTTYEAAYVDRLSPHVTTMYNVLVVEVGSPEDQRLSAL
jgi:hypothetical protein